MADARVFFFPALFSAALLMLSAAREGLVRPGIRGSGAGRHWLTFIQLLCQPFRFSQPTLYFFIFWCSHWRRVCGRGFSKGLATEKLRFLREEPLSKPCCIHNACAAVRAACSSFADALPRHFSCLLRSSLASCWRVCRYFSCYLALLCRLLRLERLVVRLSGH